MRKTAFIIVGLVLCAILGGVGQAETFQLTDNRTVSGEIVPASANEEGVQVRMDDGKYERIGWSSFSQDDLKKFVQDRRMAPFAQTFIEISDEEKMRRSEIQIAEVPRISKPGDQSLIGSMMGSGVGIFVLFLLYAANLYGAYEVAIFRAQPVPLVCGVAAIAPLIGPIVFLSMPTRMRQEEEGFETVSAPAPPTAGQPAPIPGQPAPLRTAAAAAAAAAAHQAANPTEPAGQAATEGLRLASTEPATPASVPLPQTQVFQRGAFTFNRRFFETKFPGFFGVTRRDADKDMVLLIKAARGTYVSQRISRITGSEMHVQVDKGPASEEVMIPFSEIQEIKLKHKDA